MHRSCSRLVGLAALLVAVAIGFVVAGASVAQAHPGHGHADPDRSNAQYARATQMPVVAPHQVASIVRNADNSDIHIKAEFGSYAAIVGPVSFGPATVGGLARDGGSALDIGCAFPGCCGSGPCSVCCSVVPASPGLVWPSREAAPLRIVPSPALRDAESSGLKRPPRPFA